MFSALLVCCHIKNQCINVNLPVCNFWHLEQYAKKRRRENVIARVFQTLDQMQTKWVKCLQVFFVLFQVLCINFDFTRFASFTLPMHGPCVNAEVLLCVKPPLHHFLLLLLLLYCY